jgi:hypothetical protein
MSKAAELANLIGNINAGGGGVNRNVIINGAMNVAQRGTSSTGLGGNADSYHTIDRFKLGVEGTTAGRLTMTQDSSAPSGFANSLKLACTTADTSIGAAELMVLAHIIEGQNLQSFAKGTSDAKPFAVSFYVKGNASATYVCELFDGDNTRHVCSTFNVTTDWTRVEITFPADTTGAFDNDNAASLYLQIFLHAGSNFSSGTLPATWASKTNANRAAGGSSFFDSTDRTFFITGVQLEVGQNATEFEHEPFETTLIKCKRYFERINSLSSSSSILGVGFQYNNDPQSIYQSRFSEKRTTPSLAVSNVSHLQRIRAGTSSVNSNISSISFNGTSKIGTLHDVTDQSNNLGDGCYLRFQSTDGTLDYDAEL